MLSDNHHQSLVLFGCFFGVHCKIDQHGRVGYGASEAAALTILEIKVIIFAGFAFFVQDDKVSTKMSASFR